MASNVMREPAPGKRPDGDGFVQTLRDVSHDLEELVADHLKLARVELIADAKSSLRKAVGASFTAVAAFVGYLIFMIGMAWLAAGALGPVGGFVLVGGLHLVGAGIAAAVLYQKAKKVHAPLPVTREEVQRTVDVAKDALASPEKKMGGTSEHH